MDRTIFCSSRFGKFTQLQFSMEGYLPQLAGSRVEHYLLEKTRVIALSPGERNYHIFYQLLRAPDDKKVAFELQGHTAEGKYYTNQGDLETTSIEGMEDCDRLAMTTETLSLIGVEDGAIAALYRALTAILYIGQTEFAEEAGEKSVTKNPEVVGQVALGRWGFVVVRSHLRVYSHRLRYCSVQMRTLWPADSLLGR